MCRAVMKTDAIMERTPDARKCGVGTAAAGASNPLCRPTELIVLQAPVGPRRLPHHGERAHGERARVGCRARGARAPRAP